MKRLVFAGVVGGLLGAFIFWWYQTTFQNASVPDFIGNQIVSQGKYALSKTMVGWSVHIGVSLSYGFLLAIAAQILFPGSFFLNRAASLAVALFLGHPRIRWNRPLAPVVVEQQGIARSQINAMLVIRPADVALRGQQFV